MKSKDGLRVAVIAFVTLAIATSGLVSSAQIAAAAPSNINLWAVPVTSCIDDGKLQILRLKFTDTSGSPLEKIRITIDGIKVLEFDANGNILFADPAYVSVEGSTKIKVVIGPYYYSVIEALKGKFKIAVDKDELTAGEHTALAEVFVEGDADPTLSDDATFKLKECEDGKPDLVAKHLATPHWIQMDREYHAYFTEKNQGGSKADEHVIKLFLSYDDELDSGDQLLGQTTVEQLFATRSKTFHIPFELPDDAVKGPAFLIGMTDANEVIDEEEEGNNDRIREIIIGRAVP